MSKVHWLIHGGWRLACTESVILWDRALSSSEPEAVDCKRCLAILKKRKGRK